MKNLFKLRKQRLKIIVILLLFVSKGVSAQTTLYSYQSGNWNSASTWTTDPSGTLSVNTAIPGATDNVVILNGRTITVTANTYTINTLNIKEGGILDIAATTGHNLGTVNGQGKIRLSSATFPTGTFTAFSAAGGGTVEYYNGSGFTLTHFSFNNLIINLTDPAAIVNLDNTISVNGDFTIQSGVFQFDNGGSRTATFGGDVTISSNGQFTCPAPGAGNVRHSITIQGDLTNNGTASFTSLRAGEWTSTTVPNEALSDVIFNNASQDQSIICNGLSYFYRIEIDKGIDQTYVLNIDADQAGRFYIYGLNTLQTSDNSGLTPGSIPNANSLGLLAGTLRLGENITVESMAEQDGTFGAYNIDIDACIWIDGADVTCNTVANGRGFTIYGKLKMSGTSSVFTIYDNAHSILLRGSGEIEISDGVLNANVIRTSQQAGTHIGSFSMSGGTLNLSGNNGSNNYGAFSLPYPTNVVNISGGTINITNTTATKTYCFVVGADADNCSITGGTINITIPTTRDALIASTMPFWDLNLIDDVASIYNFEIGNYSYGDNPDVDIWYQPIVVLNDFNLDAYAELVTNNEDLKVGGDFTIDNNAIYTPGTNTTIFNGNGTQTLNYLGTVTGNFENIALSETSDLTISGKDLTIDGDFTIGSGCTLRDNGFIINVNGDIENNGTHFKPATGAGSIRMVGTAAQNITGDGNGLFNNLIINNSNGITTHTDLKITSNLRLANGLLNISNNNILFDTTANVYDDITGVTQTGFGPAKMIVTNGLASDRGVSKNYGSTATFLYPFGFYNTQYYYMPASIQFTATPTTYGTVSTRPVNVRHPLAQGSLNANTCYWKTSSENFTGIPANTVAHLYYYDFNQSNDYVEGDETNYLPGFYNQNTYSWSYINNTSLVDEVTNQLSFNNANSADGDFIAGESSAFASVSKLYSIIDGPWNDPATWSTTDHDGTAGSVTPTANYVVIIGDNTHNHTVTIPSGANNQECGSLFIATGSTLDIEDTDGHDFASLPNEQVNGGGALRIGSSNYFPTGDFGSFIGEDGGTVEYYTFSGSISLPTTSTSLSLDTYHNLKLTATGTYTITLPAIDLNIYNNVVVNGGTGSVRLNTVTGGNTLTINNSLDIESGIFEFRTQAQTLVVDSNVTVASGATFQAQSTAGHTLEIKGDLAVEGTFNMNNGGTASTSFTGTQNNSISGSGTITFYNLTVNKGSDATAVLSLTADNIATGFTNPFLTLENGTFRVDNSALNLTISTTSSFDIPATACFSVKQGTATIGTTNDNGDVILYGKLELLGGTLNIGSTTGFNNDIEYASSGSPELIIEGGVLNVRGQIRRNITVTTGALNYSQTGGTLNIYGENTEDTRAYLEILNTNSSFTMSGGSIYLLNDGAITFSDLYLKPEAYDITGGSVFIGDGTHTGLAADLVISCPIWNLEVTASNSTTINTLPLTLLNNLTINTSSIFNANELNVNIGNSLFNYNTTASSGIANGGYQPGSNSQTTTFDGSSDQTITGSGSNMTNFANLVIETAGTISISSTDITINNDATLNNGILDDGSNDITLLGDFENNATHTSSTTSGGLFFAGSSTQYISGSGTGIIGNIILNNTNNVTLKDNLKITKQLTFSTGSLYADDYLLTFDSDATISGTTSSTKMIILNGVMSDLGVIKIFDSGDTDPFTFPIGLSGKYTPVTYDFSANSTSTGAITVKPVNYLHKSITTAPTDYINYYWDVTTSGFGTFTVSQAYVYGDADINGDEANYLVQQYLSATNIWNDLTNAPNIEVIPGTNTIQINNVNYIDGEYTAGEAYTSQPILYSRVATGNWTDGNTWSTTAGGSGGAYGDYPQGNPVVIESGQTVTMDGNGADAYSVTINGALNVENTTYHDLGHVSGPGTIALSASSAGMYVFPGGEYENFLANTSSTIEFTGTNDGTLPLKPGNDYKPYQNVILSSTSTKYMSAENMKINGNLTIELGSDLDNSLFNKGINLLGNWIDNNNATNGFIPGTGLVTFSGTAIQTIDVDYTEKYYNLAINNTNGVDVTLGSSGVEVTKYLYLTNGNFITSTSNLIHISNTSTIAVYGASSSSFVDGPLSKAIIAGQSFTFPTGDNSRYGAIDLSSVSGSGTYTATYVNDDPENTYATPTLTLPVSGVSNNEYWIVNPPASSSANITLRYDANSYNGFTGTSTLRSRLRVVEYEIAANTWTERGASVSGNSTTGTVATTTAVSADDFIFTIGHIGVTATIETPPTSYSICDNDETVLVPVTLSGNSPWTLTYRTSDGATTTDFTQTNITNSDYNISLIGSDMGGYSGVDYTLSLISVSDISETGICSANTVDIELKQTYKPDITGTFTVGAGEERTFSTTSNGANTYAWSWDGTSGGTPSTGTANSYTTTITSTPGDYDLEVIETTGTCTALDLQTITVVNTPAPVISPVSTNVCQNDEITYSTTDFSGHTYLWSVSGGTVTGGDINTNTITVSWSGSGAASIAVDETNSGVTGTDTDNLTISTMDDHSAITSSTSNACSSGSTGTVTLSSSFTGISYQLVLASDDSDVNGTISGTGLSVDLTTNTISTATDYYVIGANEGCQTRIPAAGNITVAITTAPTITTNAIPDLYRGVESELTYSATTGSPDLYSIDYTDPLYTDVSDASLGASIGLVVPSAATGSFSATLTVKNNSTGCNSIGYPLSKSLNTENVWTGGSGNSWFTTANWGYGSLPLTTSSIIISGSASSMPTVDGDGAVLNNMLIESGATLTSGNTRTITIDGDWTNNGTFTPGTGTLSFNGTSTISGSATHNFNNIEITSGASLTAISGNMNIAGSLTNDGTFTHNSGSLTFNGTVEQIIDGTGTLALNNVVINKASDSVSLALPVSIAGTLTLTNGIIASDATNLLTIENGASTSTGTSTSYIDGPVEKIGNSTFSFPVGDSSRFARLEMVGISNFDASTSFICQYIKAEPVDAENIHTNFDHISSMEYWNLNRNSDPGNNASCQVVLHWDNAGLSGILTNDLYVAHYTGAIWDDMGGTFTGSLGTGTGSVTSATALTSFSPITFATSQHSSVNPLPVELLYFKAEVETNGILLYWATATELNNDYFEIERSTDGVYYETISTIEGAGNSSTRIDYIETDYNPIYGIAYYRLKQTNFNGTYSYSTTVSVLWNNNSSNLDNVFNVYPNPFSSGDLIIKTENIEAGMPLNITIYDFNGRNIYTVNLINPENGKINLMPMAMQCLSRGIYIISVVSGDNLSRTKLIVE